MISVLQRSTDGGLPISLSLLYHVLPSPDSSTVPSLLASLWLPTSHSQAKEKKTAASLCSYSGAVGVGSMCLRTGVTDHDLQRFS